MIVNFLLIVFLDCRHLGYPILCMRFYPALFTDDVDVPTSVRLSLSQSFHKDIVKNVGETILPQNNCERFKKKCFLRAINDDMKTFN